MMKTHAISHPHRHKYGKKLSPLKIIILKEIQISKEEDLSILDSSQAQTGFYLL